MEPCQIVKYRYQNIDMYDKVWRNKLHGSVESINHAELPHCPISCSSSAAAAAFPAVQISGILLVRSDTTQRLKAVPS